VVLASLDDKRLYRQEVAGTPVAITSEPGTPRGLRYADMDVSPDGRWIACVREIPRGGGPVVIGPSVVAG
jgi:hypothetical protein